MSLIQVASSSSSSSHPSWDSFKERENRKEYLHNLVYSKEDKTYILLFWNSGKQHLHSFSWLINIHRDPVVHQVRACKDELVFHITDVRQQESQIASRDVRGRGTQVFSKSPQSSKGGGNTLVFPSLPNFHDR